MKIKLFLKYQKKSLSKNNIIIQNLKALDVCKRPIHCTDLKRETMYIKDNNIWEKEDDKNTKIRKVIKCVSRKNSMLINSYKDKYPDCGFSKSKKSDEYNKLVLEAFGGSGNEDVDNENKIISRISKEVTIDKHLYI